MIKCEVIIYQPGTGTKYTLVVGIIDELEDMRKLSSGSGSLFLAWESHGAYEFNDGVVPGYLAEKFNIQQFMYDAIALTELVKHKLGVPTDPNWPVCKHCDLPYHKKGMRTQCICQEYPDEYDM